MRILFVGDVVSEPGCGFIRKKLPGFKKMQNVDFCVVNGENSAVGNGITPVSAAELLTCGADIITTGNHALRRKEIYEVLDAAYPSVLRPANMHRSVPGKGAAILEKNGRRLGVGNLIGTMYMDAADNPFDAADEMLKYFEGEGVKNILIDFHAEATSEKRAMGFYTDGRASALFGTHTHVLTADAQILPKGTAYITDAGMTGVIQSVLGVKTENVTIKMKTGLPMRFDAAAGECSMSCVIAELDDKTGRAVSVESFNIT